MPESSGAVSALNLETNEHWTSKALVLQYCAAWIHSLIPFGVRQSFPDFVLTFQMVPAVVYESF